MKENLYNFSLPELEKRMISMGQKSFRAKQLFKWIYEKKVENFDEMSDISLSFREVLKENFEIKKPKLYKMQKSTDGTIKILSEFDDGNKVESVLMRYSYGNAACVSSQVGCAMKCAFCASGLLTKVRNLTTAEMVGQVLLLNDILKSEGEDSRVTHIVVMGTGEPFDNYDTVMSFIRIMNSPFAMAIGARHITVSTCGIVDKIRKYAEEGLQTNLAISLHAPNDTIRNKIMPISRRYNMEELISAVKYYEKTAGRRVTFEYILINNINDSLKEADELVNLIKGTLAYVNLIPYNEVMENEFKRSSNEHTRKFFDYLMKHGINTTVRKEFGSDIDAACGQLRAKEEKIL